VPGVVDQHVDAAERVLGRRHRVRDLVGVGDIECDGQRAVTEFVSEVLHRFGPSRSDHRAVAGR
jgi:hypothetical protein